MQDVKFARTNSQFFFDLRKNVESYFKSTNQKVTGNFKLYLKTIVLSILGISGYVWLVFFTPHPVLALSTCVVLGIIYSSIGFNVMHDGAHGSYSTKRWVNELMAFSLNILGGSAYMWKQKHNVLHHTYTNIEGMDDDIDIKPFIRTNKSQKKYWFNKYQHIYWPVFYALTYLYWIFVRDFIKYFTGKISDINIPKMTWKDHFMFWFSKTNHIFFFVVFPIYKLGPVHYLIGYLLMTIVMGLTLALVFQVAHVVEDTHFPTPNDNTNEIEENWAVHQVNTTANFSTRNKFISWWVGGLNFQVEHHLFPRISHVHYPALNKILKETCEKHNIKYIEYNTMFAAIRSHLLYLKEIGTA